MAQRSSCFVLPDCSSSEPERAAVTQGHREPASAGKLCVPALLWESKTVPCFWQALGEPLYRVSTGNYEYRLILRCRQEARTRFAKMRKDVLEKIELLDQKHGEYRCCAQHL